MKKFFLIIWLLTLDQQVFAENMDIKSKYAEEILTNDYNILREQDLVNKMRGIKTRPFTDKEDSGDFNYWQCFPTSKIKFTLNDFGYSDKSISGNENLSDLEITIESENNIIQKYYMRKAFGISAYQDRIKKWKKLMRNEKYTCLSGFFSDSETVSQDGKQKKIYSWIFDRIKTKKGCDSYSIGDCHPKIKKVANGENNGNNKTE